ncbi:glycosyltransferase [Synechococcus sp. AH-601-B19]|nr:glycosyltransferase [Synechococcus sp. AH-601-B19]
MREQASIQLLKDAQAAELCGNLETATQLYSKYYSHRPFSCSYTPLLNSKKRSDVPRLSIIVPCHNSEKYIEHCIDSILDQEFSDFELIIVEDGSSDRSLSLILAKALLDDRIILIKNDLPSGSAGLPRNQALKVAKGELIGFVDSDDWIGPSYFQTLINTLDANNADLVISSGFINHYNGVAEERVYPDKWQIKYFNNSISCTHMSSMIWDKVYKRSLLIENKILLGSYPAAVDVPFILKVYFYCAAPAVAKTSQYNYRRETENSVTVKFRKGSSCDFELKAFEEVFDWSKNNNIPDSYLSFMLLKRLSSFIYTCKLVKINYFSSYFQKCRKILQETDPQIFEEIFPLAGQNSLKSIYDLFLDGDQRGFLASQRSSDLPFLIGNKKNSQLDIPRTIQVSFQPNNTSTRNLIFFPDWSYSNPYQSLFYENMLRNKDYSDFNVIGLGVDQVDSKNLLQLVNQDDIIHIHWLHPFILNDASMQEFAEILKTLKMQKNALIIWTIHNTFSHECSDRQEELRRRRYIAKHCDRFLVHSNYALGEVENLYGVDRDKIYIIPHGKYNIDKYKAIRLINKFKDLKRRMRLTLVGDLRAYKNAEWAAEFICNINQGLFKDQFIELRIAGKSISTEQSDYLLQLANRYNFISLNLQRLSDDQLLHEFCEADFLFAPYSNLLTSGICINSISHGRPFIAPKFPSLVELCCDGKSFLYENHDELASMLLKYNDYYHRGLLPLLFDPKRIINETHDLEWSCIFSNLNRNPFVALPSP